jgi:hypothetical protein
MKGSNSSSSTGVAEVHVLYGTFLLKHECQYKSARDEFITAGSIYRDNLSVTSRVGKVIKTGFFAGDSMRVEATTLYKLGSCAEGLRDLAVAEKFYTWALDSGGSYGESGLMLNWAIEDEKAAKETFKVLKRETKKLKGELVMKQNQQQSARVVDELKRQYEEKMAFGGRGLMMHTRMIHLAHLKVTAAAAAASSSDGSNAATTTAKEVEENERKNLERSQLRGLAERGWAGRFLCLFAGRDSWQELCFR